MSDKSFYYDLKTRKWQSVRGHDCEGAIWVNDAAPEEIKSHLSKVPEFIELERKNAELRKLVEQKDAALKQALVYAEAHANRTGDKHAKKDVDSIRTALEAAERGGE